MIISNNYHTSQKLNIVHFAILIVLRRHGLWSERKQELIVNISGKAGRSGDFSVAFGISILFGLILLYAMTSIKSYNKKRKNVKIQFVSYPMRVKQRGQIIFFL